MNKKVKGFKEFMKTPRQIPAPPGGHPVPPGYKRVPDHIAGTKLVPVTETQNVEEGIGGALIGGIAGGIAAGPIGALAGAYAGHKIGQRASRNTSFVDAAIANKIADFSDKRAAKKAAAAGQTRFRPSVVSRYMRNVAVRKSGGIYATSSDGTEPVAGLVAKKPTQSNVVPLKPKAAPKQNTPAMNPTHTPNHPGHGVFPSPVTSTEVGQAISAKRKMAQLATAAAIRAAEKRNKPKITSTFDLPGARQKKERVTSSTILVPEEKVEEGVGGALIGGIAGGIAGGPLGAIAGAYAGHKIGQKASSNPSFIDAAIANKLADMSDKRAARKAAAAGQTRYRPTFVSKYLRNVAARKSGGIYVPPPNSIRIPPAPNSNPIP
jgi:hypothetical protein